MLARPIVVEVNRHAVHDSVARLDAEAHRRVVGDRAAVDRRGHAPHGGAAACPGDIEESLVQVATETAPTVARLDTHEVDVRLFGLALRKEPDEEAHDLALVQGHEARVAEVLEEQAWQHRAHRSPAPPAIDAVDERVVVRGLDLTKRDHGRRPASYSALTAAVSCARPSFASAKSIPVLGFVYSSLSIPA